MPTKASGIIYVGQARYLRRRIGELLCDLLGFTGDDYSDSEAYAHPPRDRLLWRDYCIAHVVEAFDPVSWVVLTLQMSGLRGRPKLRELMDIRWNLYPTLSCEHHSPALELFHNCSTSVAL